MKKTVAVVIGAIALVFVIALGYFNSPKPSTAQQHDNFNTVLANQGMQVTKPAFRDGSSIKAVVEVDGCQVELTTQLFTVVNPGPGYYRITAVLHKDGTPVQGYLRSGINNPTVSDVSAFLRNNSALSKGCLTR